MSGEAHGPQQKANVFAAEILSKSHFFLLPFIFLNNLVAGMNSTALDGWQFNGNARSSWDIVWAAFTTIFACTWTIIHMPVPPRSLPESAITGRKFAGWFITFLAPELIAFGAVSEFTAVRALIRRFNAAQARRDRETREPASWLYTRSKPLDVAAEWRDSSIKIYPPLPKWTLPQCFVVYIGGLTLETEDEWIFQVQPRIAHRLIDAGIIRCSDFESREIQGRAKTDGFAKAFAVLQSLWTLGNIIARAAYDLPITPLEFATLAYIVCAVITYALWWHKPQDITVPLAIHLRCTRSDLPAEVSSVTDHYPESWVHRRVIPTKWRLADLSVKLGTPVATDSGDGVAGETGVSLKTDLLVDNISGVGSLLFCGLHVIAWNFAFPTHAESIAWRVFSLTALGAVATFYAILQVPFVIRTLAAQGAVLPKFLKKVSTGPDTDPSKWEARVLQGVFIIYAIARFGMVALTLSSLRALPAGCYLAVDWWASLPHI